MKKMISKFADSLLSREDLKRVKGGYGSGCYLRWNNGSVSACSDCASYVHAGLATNWCCASCGTASWM